MHILHYNTLTNDNREKFSYVAGQYGQLVKFYNVEELCADKINEMINLVPSIKTARVGKGAFFRLLSPQILPMEKLIYLDADIIVNLDIEELWRVELYDKPLAVVPTNLQNKQKQTGIDRVMREFTMCRDNIISPEDYFNSGVLLMNLEVLRNEEENIMQGTKFRGENPQHKLFDQDILNYVFSTRTLKLPVKFNRYVRVARTEGDFELSKKIHHFAGAVIGMNMQDPFNRLWMDYFIRTPWFDTKAMGWLYAGFQQLHISLKQSMANISAIMSGKTRAFFVAPNSIDAIKNIFSVRDDEEIIPAENNESLKKLLDAMNDSRGKKVFFIMINKFPFGLLVQEGFEPGRDFVNGMEFLSEAHGVSLNSYPLIEAM